MKRLVFILCVLALLGLGCRERAPQETVDLPPELRGEAPAVVAESWTEGPLATFFPVAAGDRVKVGDLFIVVEHIESLTAEGCEGGPTGCPDSVELAVTGGSETQRIRLVVLGGDMQTASSERVVFGHRIVLGSITSNKATVAVFKTQPPVTPPFVR